MAKPMVEYGFYVNTYLGEKIPEKAFASLAAQAAGVLGSYERRYQVSGGEDAKAMAVCAMAERLQEHHRLCRHTAASVGNVSVRYEVPKESLERQLYRAAATYLDIYRGVR